MSEAALATRPSAAFISAAQLQSKTFRAVRWVVPDIIPEGLTLLAGKPKLGKSWLVLDIALAVAQGGFTLGDRHCLPGDVLYAALEDGERRLKERLSKTCHKAAWPDSLVFSTEMNRLDAGGLDYLRGWIARANDPRLVIIDTFAKVRSPKAREEGSYEADYRAAGELKKLADETGVAIVVVHHVRKMEAEDPFDMVSGTNGLTGAVDTILVMKRESGGVTLFGRGRDIEEIELAVEFQRENCRWRVLGAATDVRRSDERSAVLAALQGSAKPMTARLVSDVSGHPYEAVRKLLFKMSTAGEIQKVAKGQYALL